jgi:hypothetical protein
MRYDNKYRQSKVRCTKIALALLEGPYLIMPPVRIDKFGWLEPTLKIVERTFGIDSTGISCSVFVDNTINREDGFLEPLVRYVKWDRAYENKVKRIRVWPQAVIKHHVLQKKEQRELHNLLLAIDKSLSNIEFLTAGLITDRSDPQGCVENENLKSLPRMLKIERWNFCQRINFSLGEYNELNKKVENAARSILSYIKQVCKQDSEMNYRELYENDLKNSKQDSWFYRPPSIK